MTEQEFFKRLNEIPREIKRLQDEQKTLAWEMGIPVLIEKMKETGKSKLCLRQAGEEGIVQSEELWGTIGEGYYAVKDLELDDDGKLYAVYTTFSEQYDSYEGDFEFGDEEYRKEVDKEICQGILAKNIDTILSDDVFDLEPDEA